MQAIEATNADPDPKPSDWELTAKEIAASMISMSLHELDGQGLKTLAFQLQSLAVAKRLSDKIGPLPPAEMGRQAKAVQKAAASLRSLLQDDAFGAASHIVKQAEAFLEQDPTGSAIDSDGIASESLSLMGYQAPFARTEILGNVTFTPLAPLSHLRAHLNALEAAAQREVEASQRAGRGARKSEFRQFVIGRHLPDLYAELYPIGRKGTYNPIEGTLDGPLYRFVQLGSEALGFGQPKPEAIQQAVRRERVSPLPQ